MKYFRVVELKVCEGCGALWLRRGIGDGVYCSACSNRLATFPERGKHSGGRPKLVRRSSFGCGARSIDRGAR